MSDLHVIVGLGVTGLSCARYLHQRGFPIAITDTRTQPPFLDVLQKDCPSAQISTGKLDEALLAKASRITINRRAWPCANRSSPDRLSVVSL